MNLTKESGRLVITLTPEEEQTLDWLTSQNRFHPIVENFQRFLDQRVKQKRFEEMNQLQINLQNLAPADRAEIASDLAAITIKAEAMSKKPRF